VRVVRETERFVVIHPYASRVPFETWILPTRHQPSFGRASQEDLAALAQVLRETLRALYEGLGNPDFNYVLHSAPTEDENKPYYLWHVQILPRLTAIAGFELGSGIFITTTPPEESAALARHLLSRREAGWPRAAGERGSRGGLA
jgi:UDPglucose--hexose-1-phosphate uridylyltransferase